MVKTASKVKVALYVRKSREEEGWEETLHNQREPLVRTTEQKGYGYDPGMTWKVILQLSMLLILIFKSSKFILPFLSP